jgi:hypothetical protein
MNDMGREYERLFGALPACDAPSYLCERVIGAVLRERVRILRTRLVFSSCGVLFAFVGGLFAFSLLTAAMTASGFSAYLSLLISDSASVPALGNAYLYSLLESLPGFEVALALFFVAVLIQSLRVLIASGMDWRKTGPVLA